MLRYATCFGSWLWQSRAVRKPSCAGHGGGAGIRPGHGCITIADGRTRHPHHARRRRQVRCQEHQKATAWTAYGSGWSHCRHARIRVGARVHMIGGRCWRRFCMCSKRTVGGGPYHPTFLRGKRSTHNSGAGRKAAFGTRFGRGATRRFRESNYNCSNRRCLQASVCVWTYANGEQNTIGAALCSSSEDGADCCADMVAAYSRIHQIGRAHV